MREQAFKAAIEQYIALNRPDATSRDLTRLYHVSTTVGAVADLRANNVAQIPLVVKKDGEVVEGNHPLASVFEGGYNFTDLMQRSELAMYFWGRNLLKKRRNAFTVPIGLRWVNPNIYSLDRATREGLKGFRVYPSSMYQIEPTHYIKPRDAVYMHGVDFADDFEGAAPAERAFLEASIEPERAQTAIAVFRNLAIPFGIAQPPADGKGGAKTPEDANKFIEMLRRRFQGAVNAGRTLVSPHRWEWLQMQFMLKDLAMKEIAEEARISVCIASNTPVELIMPSSAHDETARAAMRGWGHLWLVPRVKWYAGVFTEQLASEFGPGWTVEPDIENVPFLKEDTTTRIGDVNAKLSAGYITLGQAAKEVGDTPDPVLEDLYMIQGIPVPKSELRNLWKTQLVAPPTLPPSPMGAPSDPALLPAPSTTPQLPDGAASADGAGTKSLCLMLDLADNVDVLALQGRVKELYIGQPVEWTDDFHITVLYAPSVTDSQIGALKLALEHVDLPEMSLAIGSLKSFDNIGNHALHFRVRRNTDLLDLQETVYDLCLELGIAVSTYSNPANYIPHVTVGYCPEKPRPVTFGGKVAVTPTAFLLSVGDDIVWRKEQDGKTASVKAHLDDDLYVDFKNWRISAGRRGRDYPFASNVIPKRIADYIRVALVDGDALDAVFAEAQELLHGGGAVKSYADTRQLFADEVTKYLTEGVAEETNRRNFAARMRTSLRVRGLAAFRDGMESVGYSPESFSADELASFREWQAEQSGYVSSLGAEVFGQGISEGEIAIRSRMWTDISLDDIYMRGVELGNGEERFRWDYYPSAAHCTICPLLNGKVMTAKDWRRSGFRPGNGKTPCKQGCQCKQTRTDEQVNATVEDLLALAVQA